MDVAGFPNRFCILLDFHVWVGLATTGHIRSLMIFSVHVISFVFLLSKYTNSMKVSNHCGCGKLNSVNHSLDCKLGGYTHIRHNKIRDTEARIMQEVAFDVKSEPGLQTLSRNINVTPGTKTEDNARLDISARSIFSSHELTFFDVRISNPNAPSNRSLTLSAVYSKNEKEKMKAYGDRVLQVEKGSFVPLVYTTTGGMGPLCERTHKRIAPHPETRKPGRISSEEILKLEEKR